MCALQCKCPSLFLTVNQPWPSLLAFSFHLSPHSKNTLGHNGFKRFTHKFSMCAHAGGNQRTAFAGFSYFLSTCGDEGSELGTSDFFQRLHLYPLSNFAGLGYATFFSRTLLVTVLEVEKFKIEALALNCVCGVGVGALSGSWPRPSRCPHTHGSRGEEVLFHKDTGPFMRTPPSWHNCFSKAMPPVRLRTSVDQFCGWLRHSVPSACFFLPLSKLAFRRQLYTSPEIMSLTVSGLLWRVLVFSSPSRGHDVIGS